MTGCPGIVFMTGLKVQTIKMSVQLL